MSFYHHFRKHHVPPPAFNPDDLDNLVGWLKSDTDVYQESSFSTESTNNDPVGGWKDQSPQANHFIQPTEASKATYKTNQLNGHPILEFDGSDDFLENAGTGITGDAFNGNDPTYTVFIAMKFRSVATYGDCGFAIGNDAGESNLPFQVIWGVDTTSATWYYAKRDDTGSEVGDGLMEGTIPSDTNWHIFACQQNGTAWKRWIDGSTDNDTSFDLGQITNSVCGLACQPNRETVVNQGPVDMAEVIVYSDALSTSEINNVGDYLASRYNLTWSEVS